MQYERVQRGIEQKLVEAGLYEARDEKYRGRGNGFVRLVGPAYTSSTCSSCGHVHDSEFYDELLLTLGKKNEHWQVTLVDGSTRVLPENYTYFDTKTNTEKTASVEDRLAKDLANKSVDALTDSKKKKLASLLRNNWLPFRRTQADFKCVSCGFAINADIQAAVNIARKHVFNQEETDSDSKKRKADKGKNNLERWKKWYKAKVAEGWE